MKLKKLQNTLIIFIFFSILALPALDSIFHFSPVKELFEKREPIAKPDLPKNILDAIAYPKKYEKYFNDNFGTRKTLITVNTQMMDKIFDEMTDSRIIEGKEGWFYFDNGDVVLDALGKAYLEEEVLDNAIKSYYKNWQMLKSKNIDYLVIIAADKNTIYPEYLPDYLKLGKKGSRRADKFIKALKDKYPNFPIIDLRPILKEAKKKEVIYHKTDTHWNRRGAHYAYVEIMNKLKKQNPQYKKIFTPNLRNEFTEKDDELVRGDISDVMNLNIVNRNYSLEPKFKRSYSLYKTSKAEKEKFHKPIFIANNNKALPRLFAYKDSYFSELFFFTSEHFSQSYLINEHPCNLDYQIIKDYNPNIVIQQFWEGRIGIILNNCK